MYLSQIAKCICKCACPSIKWRLTSRHRQGGSLPNPSPSLCPLILESIILRLISPLKTGLRFFLIFGLTFSAAISVACNWIPTQCATDHNSGSRVILNQMRSSFQPRISNIQNPLNADLEFENFISISTQQMLPLIIIWGVWMVDCMTSTTQTSTTPDIHNTRHPWHYG